MRVRRQRLQVAIFPFLSVLLCVLGSLILLMLVLDRKVKLAAAEHAQQERLAARDKHQQQRETEHQRQLAERQQLVDRRMREADAIRRAEEERIKAEEERVKKEQDDEVRQHLAQLQVRDEKRQKLKETVEKLQADETGQRKAVAKEQAELAALTDDLRKHQERLNLLTSSAKAGETKAAKEQERQALVSRFEAGLHDQLHLLEQVIEQVKDANKKRPPLFYLFPPNQRVPGAGRLPIYLECIGNHVIFQPDNQPWTTTEIQSSNRFVEEVRRRQAAKAASGKENAPYVLLLVRPSATMLYYSVLHALQGADIDMGYELIAEDWKVDFTDPRAEPPAEIASNRMRVATAGPAGPRGQAPKVYNGNSGGPFPEGGSETSPSGSPAMAGQPNGGSEAGAPRMGHAVGANPPYPQGGILMRPAAAGGNQLGGTGTGAGDGWHGTASGASGPLMAKGRGPANPSANAGGDGSSTGNGGAPNPGGSVPSPVVGLKQGVSGPPFMGSDLRDGQANGGARSAASGAARGADFVANGAPGVNGGPAGGGATSGAANPGGIGDGSGGGEPRALLPDIDSVPKPLPTAGSAAGGSRSSARTTSSNNADGVSRPTSTEGTSPELGSGGAGATGSGRAAGLGPPGLVPPQRGNTDNTGNAAGAGSAGSAGGDFIPGGEGAGEGDPSATPNPLEQRPKMVGGPKPVHRNGEAAKPSGPKMVGGVDREWVIVIECKADGITLPALSQRFTQTELNRADKPLFSALQQMIQLQLRRQPDIRPSLKYRIEADGLGTFYKVAAELVPLGLPAAAERVLPPAKVERPKGE
jgi:hypothetical protein